MSGLNKIFLISDDEKDVLFNQFQEVLEEGDDLNLSYSRSSLNDLKENMERDFYEIFIDLDNLDMDVNELILIIRSYLASLPIMVVISEDTSKLIRSLIPNVVFMENSYVFIVFYEMFTPKNFITQFL